MANMRGGSLAGGSLIITYENLLESILTVDGSGTGLDSDLFDGHESDEFLFKSGGTMTGDLYMSNNKRFIGSHNYGFMCGTSDGGSDYVIYIDASNYVHVGYNGRNMKLDSLNIVNKNNNKIWHADNDGSGSGLDADLLDGHHSDYFSPSNHNHDTRYLKKDGDTLNGTLRVPIARDLNKCIGLGDGFLTTVGNQAVFLNMTDGIRLSNGNELNYNKWAGLIYEVGAQTLYVGGPKGSHFRSLDNPEYIKVNMTKEDSGVSHVVLSNLNAETIQLPGNFGGIFVGDNAAIASRTGLSNNILIYGQQDRNLGGITFGIQKDTNIYRGGPNLLKTNNVFNAIGGIQWDGVSLYDLFFARRGSSINDQTDWNGITDQGTYKVQMANWGNANLHAPNEGYSYGILNVYRAATESENRTLQIYFPHTMSKTIKWRMANNGAWTEWKNIDDRSFNDTRYVLKSGDTMTGHLYMDSGKIIVGSHNYGFKCRTSDGSSDYIMYIDASNYVHVGYNGRSVKIDATNIVNQNNHKIWHADNDGPGSGLDADFIDGIESERIIYGQNKSGVTETKDIDKIWKSGFYEMYQGKNGPGDSEWYWILNCGHTSNSENYLYGMQLAGGNGTDNFYIRTRNQQGIGNWGKIYTTRNKPTPAEIGAVNKNGDNINGDLKFTGGGSPIKIEVFDAWGGWTRGIDYVNSSGAQLASIGAYGTSSHAECIYLGFESPAYTGENGFRLTRENCYYRNHKVWHEGNDGTGTGLDADLLDGLHASSFVKKSGDTMSGDLKFNTTLTGIKWEMNTDFANIYFKNDSDGDTNSYLAFVTGDNGNEGFKFMQKVGSDHRSLLDMNSDAIRGHVTIYQAGFNDYAEYFEKGEDDIEPGDLIMLDPDSEEERYIKCNEEESRYVVGICSDEYAHCIGGTGENDKENYIPLGLAGRLKVKLVGKARKGDLLTSSAIPGVAMVAKDPKMGTIIGKCLENKNTEEIERTRILIQTM